MLKPHYKNKFKKDVGLMKKRRKNLEKLQEIMSDLIKEKTLEAKYKDHSLRGNYIGCRECHIEPDWLLIYLIQNESIIFVRTGTHSDLF
jgi:mRNA interferase YafQ